MSNAYVNVQGSTGTLTATAPKPAAGGGWNLTSLSISQAGPTVGPNATVTIYDGSVTTGTVIYAAFLSAPGGGYGGGLPLGGSVGIIQDIPLPKDSQGHPGLQASPGNALNIVVTGTGANLVSINARFTDGIS